MKFCALLCTLLLKLNLIKFCFAYTIDDSVGSGRIFDGIGGLSGGGATSKLLSNYPKTERMQILDYLFLPNFASSLHILKVEIGGDAQSTEGTESSHMHAEWDENYERGYEWWLLKEAKKRNPAIKIYGLPWGFPGWIGGDTGSPYTNPNITANYIVKWVKGAKDVHGIDVDYIGIWNEREYDFTYIEALRDMLDSNGFIETKIVATDGWWDISSYIATIPKLSKAVDVIGCHYPNTVSPKVALETGKALWASEDSVSTINNNTGAACWAKKLNENYVNGMMTSTISWNLVASYYDDLPDKRSALMTANEPWSGHYDVTGPIWATAHTTQFTLPGDSYFKHGSGVGHLDHGGSYVTFKSKDGKHITIVIETMSHEGYKCVRPAVPGPQISNQTAKFSIKGNFRNILQLQVYFTQIRFDGQESTWFEKRAPLQVKHGVFSLDLGIDQIYTLTTITDRGNKGSYPESPASKPFPLPYSDNFEQYPEYSEPYNFVAQAGVWEVRNFTSGVIPHGTKVNLQVMQEPPVYWCNTGNHTLNVGGNYNWSSVSVSMDVTVPKVNGTDGAYIALRVTQGGCDMAKTKGLFFWIFPDVNGKGRYLLTGDLSASEVLDHGDGSFRFDEPLHMNLRVHGGSVASVHGRVGETDLFSLDVSSAPMNGFVGYGTNTYGLAMFDNLCVKSVH